MERNFNVHTKEFGFTGDPKMWFDGKVLLLD